MALRPRAGGRCVPAPPTPLRQAGHRPRPQSCPIDWPVKGHLVGWLPRDGPTGAGISKWPCLLSLRREERGLWSQLSNCPGFESPGMQPWPNVQVHRTPINQTVPFLHPNNLAPTPHTHTHSHSHTHGHLPLQFYMVSWKAKPSWLLSLKHLSEMFHAGAGSGYAMSFPSFPGGHGGEEARTPSCCLHTNGNSLFPQDGKKNILGSSLLKFF